MTYSVIGIDTQTDQRVHIPKLSRLQGLYIIGIPGTGKTGLIENLIIQDIEQGLGVGLLDPHGDLTQAVLDRLPDHREQDVILLDLLDTAYPFGLNLYHCDDPADATKVSFTRAQVMHIFTKLWGDESGRLGVRIEQYLRNSATTLIEKGYTMAELPLLFQNKNARSKLTVNLARPQTRSFWEGYKELKPDEQQQRYDSTLNRADAFLSEEIIYNIVGQQHTTINFRHIMDERKILLVKLDARLEEMTNLIGALIIAQFLNAAYSRADLPANKRRQFNLYADEFQRFSTEDFATLLTEARKFGIATTIAHQARFQPGMTDGIRATSLGAANLVVFRVQPQDATELAGKFERTPPPPAVDWLDENVGVKTVKAYKRDVIEHLLRQGHEDERVMVFVKDYLRELDIAAADRSGREGRRLVYIRDRATPSGKKLDSYPVNAVGNPYDPVALSRVVAELNTHLYTGMADASSLWQPLDALTHGVLADFFGFGLIFDSLYIDMEGSLPWQPAKLAWPQDDPSLAQTAALAVENTLIDFVATGQSETGVRQVWQQMGITLLASTFADLQGQANSMLARLSRKLQEAAQSSPTLDRETYERIFSTELTKPAYALAVFLPIVVHAATAAIKTMRGYSTDSATREETPNADVYTLYRRGPIIADGKAEVGLTGRVADPLLYQQVLQQRIAVQMPAYLTQFPVFLRFFATLHTCQVALSQQPLETMGSGHYEPDIRKHPIITQRSYPEMVSLIANELTNLPLYTARVKIMADGQGIEHTIRTLHPKQQADKALFGEALGERIARIKEQNIKDRYVRDRAIVEAEIRQRQAQCCEPPEEEPPPEDEPPDAIYRRPQR